MATVHITTSAAILFAQTAARMCKLAVKLDDVAEFEKLGPTQKSDYAEQLRDFSLSAVIASYSHVEATMNELYLDTILFDRPHAFPGVGTNMAARFKGAWNAGAEKLNPIEKIDLALALADLSGRIDWGASHAQSFVLLHDLRNTLIHHKPKTVEHGKAGAQSDDRIERRLHTKFSAARIWEGKGAAFRWDGCLSGSCALWAYQTAKGLVADVCGALGTAYPSQQYV